MYTYKKWGCLISIILLLGLVGNASAADVQWNNAGGDRLWRNSANWDAGVPASNSKAAIRDDTILGPIIDSSTTAVAMRLVVGDWASTSDTIDVTGGSLTTSQWFILGYGSANNGTFTISSGTVNVGSDLYVGFMGTGTIDITGGSITVTGTFGIAQQSGGIGDVFLDGGTITSGSFNMTSGAAMDITAGTLIVNGDVTSTVNGYISSGWITAYNGTGTVNVDYDVTNPGKTTVTGEPAGPPPPPGQATNPSPADGATNVSITATLSWTAGSGATSHDVYFGTTSPGTFQGNQTSTTFDPGTMANDTTYYWRIDEVNAGGTTTGNVWSFTTVAEGLSDTTDDGTGTISANGDNPPNETMAEAFDNSTSTKWLDFSPSYSWIQYQYAAGNRSVVTEYTLTSANDAQERDPMDWNILGSNNGGTSWDTLDTRTGELFTARFQTRSFQFTNSTAYNIYRLEITQVRNGATANSVQIAEIELIGTPPAPPGPPGQATNPSPANGATDVSATANLSWTAGSGATSHDVYFGTDSTPDSSEFQGNQTATTFDPGTMANSTTYYWRIDEVNASGTTTGTVWSFTTAAAPPPLPGQATNPSPADGATDVSTTAGLSWTAGSDATSHDVYFGTDSTPDSSEFQGNQTATTFDPGTLANSTTYYWRIDEVNASGTTTGTVWSFTTSAAPPPLPGQATNPSPADGATDVSTTAGLSWTAGSDATSHDVYFGTDSTPDSSEFQGNQTATTFDPGTLANSTTYYWRIDEVNASGTTTGTVWSFTTAAAPPPLPGQATNPSPADGATDVSTTADLTWTAGSDATSHDVYFGTDSTPDSSEFQGNQTSTTFDPGTMANDTTYYWRIDEVNASGTTTGVVWSFTTIVAGLSDTTDDGTGTISARGENLPNEGMDKAFDNLTSTKWLDFSPSYSWIQYQYAAGNRSVVTEYTLTSANDAQERDPMDWNILGSNNGGTSWDTLDTRTGELFTARFQTRSFQFTNSTAYNIYRLEITQVRDGATANSVQLAEIELIGTTPEPPGPQPPSQATSPDPANSATNVSVTANLTWAAGDGATSHDVYFGTTSPGSFQGNQTSTTFNPGTMANDTTYYWRIDEKNAYGTTTGNVWNFTTEPAAPGVDRDWTNAGGDRLWRNSANWSGTAVPSSADKAAIRNSGPGPIIDSSTTAVARYVVLSDWSSTGDTLDVTGGTLSTADWFVIGYQAANNGTFTVSGGTVDVGTYLYVGNMGTGTLQITGGTINVVSTLGIAQQTGSVGDVFLDGGTISAGSFNMTSGGWMDITAGTLIVNGDVTSTINGYISSGWITAYSGTGTVNVDYDVTNPGKTTVTGEPAGPPPPPGQATNPSPADGATGVSTTAGLSWTAGSGADSHDVYFGTTSPGTFQGNQTGTTFNPGTMANDTTYYWRIDEVNAGGTTTGVVWSFTTGAAGLPVFTFVHAADPQMTYCADSPSLWTVTIDKVNIVNPAFLVVGGDLLNSVGSQSQANTYLSIASGLNPGITRYDLAGNHDVHDAPTSSSYSWYQARFGDLWYSFTHGNNLFIVLESSVLRDASGYPGKDTEQMNWLTATLSGASGYNNITVFMHHPLCVSSIGEADSSWNIPTARRSELINLFQTYGVKAAFAGHYHRNAYVRDGDLEIITTSSCTCPLGPDLPGFRIVKVFPDRIEQTYRDLNGIVATEVDWTNASGDRLWRNPDNWGWNAVPTSIDKAAIRNSAISGPIIDSSTVAEANVVVVGDWGSTTDTLDMTGGTLTTNSWVVLGHDSINNGTFNISGGTVSIGNDLIVGRSGIGTINMTGGSITVTYLVGLAQLGGTGHIQLDGGTISCGLFNMVSGATIDFAGGALLITGDVTLTINQYIANGWITSYGGGGAVSVDYNITNPGKTTVAATAPGKAFSPNPADGATGVGINDNLSWTAGSEATSHDVYFGTDSTPDATEFQGNQTSTTFDPGTMALNTTYYWRIDEVNPAHPDSPWTGDVWSFATTVVDSSYSLVEKIMCGYQGWFNCPGDGTDRNWVHWGINGFSPSNCTVDMWPDMTEIDSGGRFLASNFYDGTNHYVFSSHNRNTVLLHFQWMKDYGIDGIFLQRFATDIAPGSPGFNHRNDVLDYCKEGANLHGRKYAIMYDLSGLGSGGDIQRVVDDWKYLVDTKQVGRDPGDNGHMFHQGKPVVGVWGLGYGRPYEGQATRNLIDFLKNDPAYGDNIVVIGVHQNWRTNSNSWFQQTLQIADVIVPWLVGAYSTGGGINNWASSKGVPDKNWCNANGKDYMPIMFPGFSFHNAGGGSLNQIPRAGGQFLWDQLKADISTVGANMLFVAMFDEVDEGTAIFKVTNDPPVVSPAQFVTYDIDGYPLPSDEYLWLVGQAARGLRGEIPVNQTRPAR